MTSFSAQRTEGGRNERTCNNPPPRPVDELHVDDQHQHSNSANNGNIHNIAIPSGLGGDCHKISAAAYHHGSSSTTTLRTKGSSSTTCGTKEESSSRDNNYDREMMMPSIASQTGHTGDDAGSRPGDDEYGEDDIESAKNPPRGPSAIQQLEAQQQPHPPPVGEAGPRAEEDSERVNNAVVAISKAGWTTETTPELLASLPTKLKGDPRRTEAEHLTDTVSVDGSLMTKPSRTVPTWTITLLIVILGAATCGAFLAVGISFATQEESDQFNNRAEDLVKELRRAWEDYVTAASWIHGQCRTRNFTRADYRRMYEYLVGSGLQFKAAQFDPNITHAERPVAEAEARAFYSQHYPHVEYRGIVGFETSNSTVLEPRSEQDFYFPIHYMEPIEGNERAIDLDYHASGSRKRTVQFCMDNGQPALTDRLVLVQETVELAFGVVLMHPGFNLTDQVAKLSVSSAASDGGDNTTTTANNGGENEVWPRDLASIVIRIPDLLDRAGKNRGDASVVYLYDNSDSGGVPMFLGAAQITPPDQPGSGLGLADLKPLVERTYDDLQAYVRSANVLYREETVLAANKEWIVSVLSVEGTYQPDTVFVIVGGVIILLASMALAFWMYSHQRSIDAYNKMRATAEAERASLILENARQATKAERELNDFIAHEVRNPVAAAMSACSFVKVAIEGDDPLRSVEQRQETRDDVNIIDSALRFVNDLLRNMLDMHRAANRQLKVNLTPTDILHDVLESVQVMLPQRDPKFTIEVQCPEGLVVMTDRLRLKQVCLNLARNSVKFVHEGFIRLRAEVVDGEVNLFVEDSGPGIPVDKRAILFSKFQESLDSLSQGTVRMNDGDGYQG